MVYTDKIHLMADSVVELHLFAIKIGLKRFWFQNTKYPHYDLFRSKIGTAIKAGAKVVSSKELIKIWRAK